MVNNIKKDLVETVRRFAWTPVRVTSNRIVWLNFYYEETYFINFADMFRQLVTHRYTEAEYFLKKMSE